MYCAGLNQRMRTRNVVETCVESNEMKYLKRLQLREYKRFHCQICQLRTHSSWINRCIQRSWILLPLFTQQKMCTRLTSLFFRISHCTCPIRRFFFSSIKYRFSVVHVSIDKYFFFHCDWKCFFSYWITC